jgi:exodeoxyribonuclease V alpha subunit
MKNQTIDKMLFKYTELKEQIFELLNLNSIDYYTIMDLIGYLKNYDDETIKSIFVILSCMFDSLKNGSICLNLNGEQITYQLEKINYNKKFLDPVINSIINKKFFHEIIGYDENDYKPLIFKNLNNKPFIYFQKYFFYEKELRLCLDLLLSKKNKNNLPENIIDEIKKSSLDEKQKVAVYFGLINNFTIISGGPGTGKTYIIYFILRMLAKLGLEPSKIKVAAPTGRASQRLTESIRCNLLKENDISIKDMIGKIEGETIHKILHYSRLTDNFTYNENNRFSIDALIVDEVSMVDLVLMAKLLRSLPEKCRVVFLGDKNQIPSVEAGAVLTELIPSNFKESFSKEVNKVTENLKVSEKLIKTTDRIIILEKCFRTDEKILKVAEMINQKNISSLAIIKKIKIDEKMFLDSINDIYIIKQDKNNREALNIVITRWIKKYFIDKGYINLINDIATIDSQKYDRELLLNLFNIMGNNKILCIIKESLYGVNYINSIIKNLFENKIIYKTEKYFSGMPIIINKNDYRKNLFNGDAGIIIRDITGIFRAVFFKNDTFRFYPVDFLPPHDMAFSITVHKSQGSEYNDVLLILPDNESNKLLTKEILYTAITRSRSTVYIYSDEEILKKCIMTQVSRESGINLYE